MKEEQDDFFGDGKEASSIENKSQNSECAKSVSLSEEENVKIDSGQNNTNLKIEKNKIDINDDEAEDNKNNKSIFSFTFITNENNFSRTNTKTELEKSLGESSVGASDIKNLNNQFTIWEEIKNRFNNVKNEIIFNHNIFNGQKNINSLQPTELPVEIQIFDKKYINQDENLINHLQNIPWFSYRKNFDQISENGQTYTSDAGWGCILRASQMILAQGLCRLSSINTLEKFIEKYIGYFYDNIIPNKFVKRNSNIKVEKNENKNKSNSCNQEINKSGFEIIEKKEYLDKSFEIVDLDFIEGMENISIRKSNKEYLLPPFSLRSFLKNYRINNKNAIFRKNVGDWFSNYDMIKLITSISERMYNKNDSDFKILNFSEGTIYLKDIFDACFKEEYKNIDHEGFELLSISNIEKEEKEKEINSNLEKNIYVFDKKHYLLKNKFILFVSVRHGLYNLDENMSDEVLKIFDIETNIGIIGGKKTRAYYFIGKCEKNLLFLDPHYVQETVSLIDSRGYSIEKSYRPNDVFYMDVSEMSPTFSFGFAIKDMSDFKRLMKHLKSEEYFVNVSQNLKLSFRKDKNFLFTVKNFHYVKEVDKQDVSINVLVNDSFY